MVKDLRVKSIEPKAIEAGAVAATEQKQVSPIASAQTCSLLPPIVLEILLSFILEPQLMDTYAAVHRVFSAAIWMPHAWSGVVLDFRGLQVSLKMRASVGALWKYVRQLIVDHSSSDAWLHFPVAIPLYFQWGWLQNPVGLIANPIVNPNRSTRIRTSRTPVASQFSVSLEFLGVLPNFSIGFANTNDITELKICERSSISSLGPRPMQHLWFQIRLMDPIERRLPRDSKIYLNGSRLSRSRGTRMPMELAGNYGSITRFEITLTRFGNAMYLHVGDVFLRSFSLPPTCLRCFARCSWYAVLAIDEDYGFDNMSAVALTSRLQ